KELSAEKPAGAAGASKAGASGAGGGAAGATGSKEGGLETLLEISMFELLDIHGLRRIRSQFPLHVPFSRRPGQKLSERFTILFFRGPGRVPVFNPFR
ncbi:MAG TPA: hypothetical protein VK420_12980, partial [Longimicrobium sp.]|nr:hypothetical protein [Longimicrobium sp.]